MNWMGLNMGFRVSMAAVVLIVITMNAAFLEHEASKDGQRRGETHPTSQQEFPSLAQRTVADEAVLRKLSILCVKNRRSKQRKFKIRYRKQAKHLLRLFAYSAVFCRFIAYARHASASGIT